MESKWAGVSEDSFFNPQMIDKNRKINLPENKYSEHSTKTSYYMLSIDIGRKGASTEVFVFKVIPQVSGESIKAVVNIFTYDDMHIEDQVIEFKRLFYLFKCKYMVIDGNGIGINYVDLLVKSQYDAENGITYPDFGIMNDEENYYKKYQTENCEGEVIYIIKAHAGTNTEMYTNAHTQLKSSHVRLLIDERTAKAKLLETKKGQLMTSQERNAYLAPFVRTTLLKEQILNLKEENEGINIILKQSNKHIKKDKFSAFIMGLYFAKKLEERKKKKKGKISNYMFMN